jgi:hypothetical protein
MIIQFPDRRWEIYKQKYGLVERKVNPVEPTTHLRAVKGKLEDGKLQEENNYNVRRNKNHPNDPE